MISLYFFKVIGRNKWLQKIGGTRSPRPLLNLPLELRTWANILSTKRERKIPLVTLKKHEHRAKLALKTCWLLVPTVLQHCFKILRPHLVSVQTIELEPRPPLKKIISFYLLKFFYKIQKQLLQIFCKKCSLKFHRKTPVLEFLYNEVADT